MPLCRTFSLLFTNTPRILFMILSVEGAIQHLQIDIINERIYSSSAIKMIKMFFTYFIYTGGIVPTRIQAALIHFFFASNTGVTRWTVAAEGIFQINACPVIHTRIAGAVLKIFKTNF